MTCNPGSAEGSQADGTPSVLHIVTEVFVQSQNCVVMDLVCLGQFVQLCSHHGGAPIPPITYGQLVSLSSSSCGRAALHKLDTCAPSSCVGAEVTKLQRRHLIVPVHCMTGFKSRLPPKIWPTASGVSDAAILSRSHFAPKRCRPRAAAAIRSPSSRHTCLGES